MLDILFYAAVLAALGFLILPLAIGLTLERPSDSALRLRLDGAFFRGLAGASFLYRHPRWTFYPLLLGWRLPLPLRAGPRISRPSAPETGVRRVPTPTAPALWLLRPIVGLLISMPRAIGLKKLHVCGCFGFDDPARTGSVFGYMQSLNLAHKKRVRVDLIPDFSRPGFRGSLYLGVHLYLGLFLFLALRCALRVSFRWIARRLPWSSWKPGFF